MNHENKCLMINWVELFQFPFAALSPVVFPEPGNWISQAAFKDKYRSTPARNESQQVHQSIIVSQFTFLWKTS